MRIVLMFWGFMGCEGDGDGDGEEREWGGKRMVGEEMVREG